MDWWSQALFIMRPQMRPPFADETGTGSGGRTNGEEPETLAALLDAYQEKTEYYKDGIQGEILFEPFSRGVNSETRAIYFKKEEQAKRMRSYYVMQTFVNGIAGKDMYYVPAHIYNVKPEVHVMAFVNDDELFLALINRSQDDLEGLSVLWEGAFSHEKAEQTQFDISLPLEGQKEELDITDNSLVISLSSESITFLKIQL